MIPRALHHIWLGPKAVPEAWAEAWAKAHPGWEHRVWREQDLAGLRMKNGTLYRKLLAEEVWHGAADVARLEVLWEHGGVYVDIDSRPLTSMEGAPFMTADAFAGYEPTPTMPGRVANGTIGSVARGHVVGTARTLVHGMLAYDPPWDTIGAPALTAAFLLHRRCCDSRVLPERTFYPHNAKGHPVRGNGVSYSEHYWATTTRRYPARVVVLVPRREGIPERDRIWAWCRRIWEQQGWPVYEGHDPGQGLFNASLARNRAAAAADADGGWDVAVFADADTVPWDWSPVRRAVEQARSTGQFIRPANAYFLLDEAATERFMETGIKPTRGARRLGQHVYGGIHVVPRELWDKVGGYDERFLGWGGEDAAFQYSCQAVGGYRRLSGEVFHLFHPMQQRDPSTDQFRANVALEKRYVDAARSRDAMQQLLAEDRRL